MTHPTLRDIERAICCPGGTCASPTACYAEDRSRSYRVQIHEAARAVGALYLAAWRAYPVSDGPITRRKVLGDGE